LATLTLGSGGVAMVLSHRAPLHHAIPRVEEADQLVAIDQFALADDCSDDCVETGAVAPTCQNAYSHVHRS